MKYASFKDIDHALGMIAKIESSINNRKVAYEKSIADDQREADLLKSEIEAFCIKNKSKFSKDLIKRLDNGSVGFRINEKKVYQLNKSFTVAKTIDLLKAIFISGEYIKTSESINKEQIITDYNVGALDDGSLAGVGLKVEQSESFFISANPVEATIKIKSEVVKA